MTWTPIRTMRRGTRPNFTLLRQPGNNYTTPAQQWFLDQMLDLEPGTEDVDGGGYAHKSGYHDTVAHNDARSGVGKNYSASDPVDRRGPHTKTRARDWTFRDAQAGRYADFAKYGDRVYAAYRANDPRLKGWREYLGRVSTPVTIKGVSTRRIGMDFRGRYLRIPDSTHDWHGHFSENTEQVESFANKWALLTVLAGWSLAEWRQSITSTPNNTEDGNMSDTTEGKVHSIFTGMFTGGSSMGRKVDPDGDGSQPAANSLVAKLDYLLRVLDDNTHALLTANNLATNADTKTNQILDRLAAIEAKLDGTPQS